MITDNQIEMMPNPGSQPGRIWCPRRVLTDQERNRVQSELRRVGTEVLVAPTTETVNPAGNNGIPFDLLSISATESPVKQQDRTFSQVSVSFTRNPSDDSFAGVRVWFKGYNGSSTPQLMASGAESPITFLCETTHDTVTVYAQPIGKTGAAGNLNFAAITTLALDGVVSPPPAPSIEQILVPTPLGFQFSFNQVALGDNQQDVISCYKVYRSATDDAATAILIRTFTHDPSAVGAIVVQDNVGGGETYFYWVTAVNTTGLESAKTPAQAEPTTSGSVSLIGGDIGVKGSIPDSYVPGLAYTATTNSITWSWNITGIRTDLNLTLFTAVGSQAITGLPSGTSYNFYPFYDENADALSMVATGGTGTPSWAHAGTDRSWTAEQGRQDHIPLSNSPVAASTTSTGTSTGGGGGDGGCLKSTMFVKERTRGVIATKEVQAGDYLWTEEGWIEVVKTRTSKHDLWCEIEFNNGAAAQVTTGHPWTLAEDHSMKRASQLCIEDGIPCPTGVTFPVSIRFLKEEAEKVMIECVAPHVFYASRDGEGWVLTHNARMVTY